MVFAGPRAKRRASMQPFLNPEKSPGVKLRGLSIGTFRGSTILHEMLHVLFEQFLHDVGRRANASCYQVFALRVNGFGGDPVAVLRCTGA